MSTTEGIPSQATAHDHRSGQAQRRDLPRFVAEDGTVRDVVSVRLPAAAAYLAVLRTTTASLAARLDFTLDEIEDLRIAVDEASCLLLAGALPTSELSCVFEMSADSIQIAVSTETTDGRAPARDSFAWTVLSALAGEVDAWTEPDGRQTISLVKRRAREASA
ncbi:MAG: serine/threonine-protein kinase RsbW [Actinomycetota bacterium]|nr:serine/threonine-protein kinase RsbW [Actinomycetota bacterium]